MRNLNEKSLAKAIIKFNAVIMIANVMMKAGHSRYQITSFSCFFSFGLSGNLRDSVLFIYRMDKLSGHRCAHSGQLLVTPNIECMNKITVYLKSNVHQLEKRSKAQRIKYCTNTLVVLLFFISL